MKIRGILYLLARLWRPGPGSPLQTPARPGKSRHGAANDSSAILCGLGRRRELVRRAPALPLDLQGLGDYPAMAAARHPRSGL